MCDAVDQKELAARAHTLEALFADGQARGLFVDKISYCFKENLLGKQYFHLCAAQRLSDGEALLRIPSQLIISAKMLNKNAVLARITRERPQLFNSHDRFFNQVNMLILLVLHEIARGEESCFALYFTHVFELNNVDHWQPENFAYVKDRFLREYMEAEHRKARQLFQRFEPLLGEHAALLGAVDWPAFMRVTMLIESRYFHDRLDQLLLIPFFDLLNHSNDPNVSFRVERPEAGPPPAAAWRVERLGDVSENATPRRGPDPLKSRLYQLVSYHLKWYECPWGGQSSTSASNYSAELNHSSVFDNCSQSCEGEDAACDEEVVVFTDAVGPLRAGDELTISYGNRSNFFLMTWYGFCLRANRYDDFRFYFDAARYERDPAAGCRDLTAFVSFRRGARNELVKARAGAIHLGLLASIRVGLYRLDFEDRLELEMAAVAAYRDLFQRLLAAFAVERPAPAGDFQGYIRLYDEEMEAIARRHCRMAGRLLHLLGRIASEPRFDFRNFASFLPAGAHDPEKLAVLESLLELKDYFSQILEPMQVTWAR